MNLGAFSVSLVVKDLNKSKEFYAKLGFIPLSPDTGQGWLILKNGDHIIGLFQDMFESNILTFNPGWDQNAKNLEEFTDVRDLQKQLREQDIEFVAEADESTEGPAHLIVTDPDGNTIMLDQHR